MINLKHKKAFSMITAIFVIFIMSSVTMLIMNISGKTVKATTHQYQKEQAELLARSYTELAILYALHYERNATNGCLESISDHFGEMSPNGYDIRINIQYIGKGSELANCSASSVIATLDGATGFDKTISLIIDTFVSYKDFDDPSSLVANGDRNITFHRRTLQKL